MMRTFLVSSALCLLMHISGASGASEELAWPFGSGVRAAASRGSSRLVGCHEKKMEGICKCNKWSKKILAWQCSGCIDESKWGYGCDLDCPKDCPKTCDFSGDCITESSKDDCPANCKRNSRVAHPNAEGVCLNDFGQCQACAHEFHGEMCEDKCPEHCGDSSEGKCTRSGLCYNCANGWFGALCDKKCPEGCPKCQMEDGTNDAGETVPAGTCTQECDGNFHGPSCDLPCPTTCGKGALLGKNWWLGRAICRKSDGACHTCAKGFWGPTCEKECSSGCRGGEGKRGGSCHQTDGHCTECGAGFWGGSCETECPEYTSSEGCGQSDGYPKGCDATHYPSREKGGNGFCKDCPENCKEGVCDSRGKCKKGCAAGFSGPRCDKGCAKGCVGGCDKDGLCKSCKPGLTGKTCAEKCDSSCETCTQFTSGLYAVYAGSGTGAKDCMSCPAGEPSELEAAGPGACACIKGAAREDDDKKCHCSEPDDVLKEAFFESEGRKQCSTRCKASYEGEGLSIVYGGGKSDCIRKSLYNGVVIAGMNNDNNLSGKGEQGCKPDEYPIDVKGEVKCLFDKFADFILGKVE